MRCWSHIGIVTASLNKAKHILDIIEPLCGVAAGRRAGPGVDHPLADLARPLRDDMRRLQTVPGVGPVVALTALAVFDDVPRFASAKHLASYAGLVPSTYPSGDCDRHGHITKRSAAELRAMLCEAADHCRPSHPLHRP